MLRVRRFGGRQISGMEVAAFIAIAGSVCAVAIPSFFRELHASRFVEPVEGLKRIGVAALAYSEGHDVVSAFPASAPLTPQQPPRGKLDVEPDNAWDTATWQALHFRASPSGVPHAFAFAFDSFPSATHSRFVARAHGDLDGDSVLSTFEIRGHATASTLTANGAPRVTALVDPEMYVESEVE